ncbi:LCP family protein [Nocardia sp. NPDC023852]|uniref:LCP family protein n=1 Tax=Nocardia sp. NPDC023852 TaxID=3154697 RepID=UPI0033F7AEDC
MGDDRHGRSPRPGGRAPWERYPAADYPERDAEQASRRSRHTDAAHDQSSAPLTVQDLVQRVDNERGGRRGRRAAAPQDAGAPPARGRRTEPTPQDAGPPPVRGRRTEPAPRQAAPPGPAEPGARRPPEPANGRGAAGPRRPPDAPAPRHTGSSPVVQDIAGEHATPTSRAGGRRPAERPEPGIRPEPEPAEEVTDVLPPLTEPTRAKRKSSGWPTTESKAVKPKAVGAPSQSRLEAARQRRKTRMRTAGRAAVAGVSVLVLLATGGGWSYLRSTANGFTQVSALDDNTEDVVDSGAQLGDENFLLVGTDTRVGANGQLGAGSTDDAEGSRADTVMLVNIPKNRSRVVVVSFPRDLDVSRPRCNGWDNEKINYTNEVFPAAMGDKLNAVYALGGPKCLFNVISKMTGLSINHFISIDFAGFEAMVDQVGGVDVCASKPIVDGILGTVLENPGMQHVSGETALNYVRARHVYGEERSDYDRINRQQRFLASLLRGALSSKVLFDPGKLRGFIDAFTKHTWVDQVDTNDLLTLGRSLQKVDAGAVTFLTIPTAGTTSYGNEIPRESDIKAIFRAVIDDQPLPGEKKVAPAPGSSTTAPPAPPKLTAVDPSTVSLLVSNASGVGGVANKASTKLGNQGFQIYNTGNYSNGTATTSKIRYAAGHEAEAATVASAIPGTTLEQASDLGGIIEVVLGTDFTGTVTSPVPVGDPITNVPVSSTASMTPVNLPSDLEHVNAAEDICK